MIGEQDKVGWLAADWDAPHNIHAGTTTRIGGVSDPPFDQLNLGTHVKDEINNVQKNRECLSRQLKLPAEPVWLNQAHGNNIIHIDDDIADYNADGSYSIEVNKVCAVMTADCLPLLLCNDEGTQIAAIHIGWRGFSKNIIANALDKFTCPHGKIMAWLGPCISTENYEIDATVYNAISKIFPDTENCFIQSYMGHWLMDLRQLVSKQLYALGVRHIYISPYCTYSDHLRFFSYRRDGATGRMASLIWMDR